MTIHATQPYSGKGESQKWRGNTQEVETHNVIEALCKTHNAIEGDEVDLIS